MGNELRLLQYGLSWQLTQWNVVVTARWAVAVGTVATGRWAPWAVAIAVRLCGLLASGSVTNSRWLLWAVAMGTGCQALWVVPCRGQRLQVSARCGRAAEQG